MSFQFERYVKKAKKEHRCEWCAAHIKVGGGYYAISGHDGDFYAYALCERCHDVMDKFFYEIFGDRVVDSIGEFQERIISEYGLCACPSCRRMSAYEWRVFQRAWARPAAIYGKRDMGYLNEAI